MESQLGIRNMPDEILVKIFSYCTYKDLVKVAFVCEHWCQLCRDKSLFQNVILSNDLNLDDVKVIISLFASSKPNCAFSLKILNRNDSIVILNLLTKFVAVHKETFTQYSFAFEKCCCSNEIINANLDSRESNLSNLDTNTLTIKSSCNDVTSLLLRYFYKNKCCDVSEFFGNSLQKIDVSCTLPFTSCIFISLSCFCVHVKELVELCKNLEVFKFKNNVHRKYGFYYTLPTCCDSMSFIFRHLCIHNNRLGVLKIPALGLLDVDVLLLKDLCHLSVLHLYAARRLSSSSLQVFRSLNKLKSFLLTENIMISPESWAAFIGHSEMKLIEALGFDECLVDNSVMFSISRTCKNLKKLSLNGCRDEMCDLTSEGLIAVFISCKKLKKVSLRYVDKQLKVALNSLPDNINKVDFIPIN